MVKKTKELGMEEKDVEKLFKEREDERVELLKESVQDIQTMIQEREKLHKEMLNSLDKIDISINNSMPKIEGESSDLMKELIKKKIEIAELKVQEELNFWRDHALLKKELREHMKEFRDMESKTSLVDSILEI